MKFLNRIKDVFAGVFSKIGNVFKKASASLGKISVLKRIPLKGLLAKFGGTGGGKGNSKGIKFLLSCLIFGAILFLAITLDTGKMRFYFRNFTFFLDFPALIFVFAPTIAFAIAATSLNTFRQSILFTFTGRIPGDAQGVKILVRYFRVIGNSSILVGVLGTLLGAVLLLQNMVSPKQVPLALAVALLTLVYGLAMKILCYAAEMAVRSRYSGL